MQLEDYEIFQTLGTGTFPHSPDPSPRLLWTRQTCKKQEGTALRRTQNIEKSRDHPPQISRPCHIRKHNFTKHPLSLYRKDFSEDSYIFYQVNMDGFCQDKRYLYLVLEYI